MNIALIMGRAGSKSIHGKNICQVLGRPLASYPMHAALQSKKIDRVLVTSDCPDIQAIATEMGVERIERPPELSRDDSQMVDGILHALDFIGPDIDYLVTMHCNCATHRPGLIDECIAQLDKHPEADACVSGVIDKAVHPFRTRRISPEGMLETWSEIPINTSSNRQSLDPCVILDGAARAIRVASCFPVHGSPPFPYLGETIRVVENPGGRDIHDTDDILLTEQYLLRHGWSQNREDD